MGSNQTSLEGGKRRVVVTANVRDRNFGSFVAEARRRVDAEVSFPTGWYTTWGGQFKTLRATKQRLLLVVHHSSR